MKLSIVGGSVECHQDFSTEKWRTFYQAIMYDKVTHVQQLKHDGTTTVYFAHIDGVACVVKRYNTKNVWHFIRRGFRRSRADICYELSDRYQQAGINTPASIAKIQAHFGPFKMRSWYLCHYLDGELLQDVVAEQALSEPNKLPTTALLSAVRNLFSKLASNQLSHGDMKATNLIWKANKLFIIDLDAARQHPSMSKSHRALHKDQQRFIQNWRDKPEIQSAFQHAIKPIKAHGQA